VTAADQNAALQHLLPLNTPLFQLYMYVALEDGPIMFDFDDYITMEYQEPGNSGYPIMNIKSDDLYYKRYISCIEYET
jgi:hypothetical protein